MPLGEQATVWLAAYRDRVRPGLVAGRHPVNLFLSRDGRALEPKRLSEKVRGYVEAAGTTKPGSCHLLRHTAAKLLLEGGADIRFIQAMLGHESLETAQITPAYRRPSSPRSAPPPTPVRHWCAIGLCLIPRGPPKARTPNKACYPHPRRIW